MPRVCRTVMRPRSCRWESRSSWRDVFASPIASMVRGSSSARAHLSWRRKRSWRVRSIFWEASPHTIGSKFTSCCRWRKSAKTEDVERRDNFWNGVVYYREKRWEEAYAEFQKSWGANGHEDAPLQLYLRRLEPLVLHLTESPTPSELPHLRRTEYPGAMRDLIAQLRQMPGVGPRSAERIALWMVQARGDQPGEIARAINETRQRCGPASRCGFFTTDEALRDLRRLLPRGRTALRGGAADRYSSTGKNERFSRPLSLVRRTHFAARSCWPGRFADQGIARSGREREHFLKSSSRFPPTSKARRQPITWSIC